MPTLQADYFAAYRSLTLTRDTNGVLVVGFHSNGGPFMFTAHDHTEFVDAFYRIAQDRANKIVILTGAGGEFIPDIDFASFGNVADLPAFGARCTTKACRFWKTSPTSACR
jgi:enoyl-CoA hydratase/carnithine racemase